MSGYSDPDLVAALEELAEPVRKLGLLEAQLADPAAEATAFRFGRIVEGRGQILDRITNRAQRLNLKPGSLRIAVELANRHRERTRKRIPLSQLRRDLDTALASMRAHHTEAAAAFAIAKHRSAFAEQRVVDGDAAVDYLEACRS